jgi:hypothetical protein
MKSLRNGRVVGLELRMSRSTSTSSPVSRQALERFSLGV